MSQKTACETKPKTGVWSAGYKPTAEEIEKLIASAKKHDLGVDLLVNGPLDAVAATFNVHAFAVDAAREKLQTRR